MADGRLVGALRAVTPANVAAFVQLSRPHFLAGGVLMVILGSQYASGWTGTQYTYALVMVLSIQLTAQFFNEFADFKPDQLVANRTLFSGGSGVLATGRLHRNVAFSGATVTAAIAIAMVRGVRTFSIDAAWLGLAALVGAVLYSFVMRTGWGEIEASIVVTILFPTSAALALGGAVTSGLWWSIAALLPVHMGMMLAFEIPDLDSDAQVGKRVLAVRIGRDRTVSLMAVLLGLGVVALLASRWIGPLGAGIVAGAAGLSVVAIAAIVLAGTDRYHALTAAGVLAFVITAVALILTAPPFSAG